MDRYRGFQAQLSDYLTSESSPGREQILRLLQEPDDGEFHSLCLNACHLWQCCHLVINACLLSPQWALAQCDHIVVEACKKVFDGLTDHDLKARCSAKTRLRFRISALPDHAEFSRAKVPKAEDVGLLLSLSGMVIKVEMPPRMLQFAKTLQCSKCRRIFTVEADFELHNRLATPAYCPEDGCGGVHFASVGEEVNPEWCKDYQERMEIKVQELVGSGSRNLGTIPRSITVTLEDDLVDTCQPGDDVTVIGVVMRRWHAMGKAPNGRTDIQLAIQANHLQVNNNQRSKHLLKEEQVKEFELFWERHKWDPLAARERILASFCPQIYGLYTVKMALCVTLCGGVERIDESGTRVRGEPHLLLVGDPGTGKSQLLRYAAKISLRSVLTSGAGITNAGLTASAVRESGQWHLEAGALVLADRGICCIDEFNSMKEGDKTCIHEAMEQQSISVAKAGLVCKLQTRCSVLAATNPNGRFYDPDKPLTVNTGIGSPLLSRFDLVFTLLDSRDETWDRLVSSYILEGKDIRRELSKGPTPWSSNKLQAYFIYCKTINPELGETASVILSRYFQKQRRGYDPSLARTTIRLLQSTVRLAQGHARLMRHSEVSVLDAVYAVVLLETSTETCAPLLTSGGNTLHTTFPDDPAAEYRSRAEAVLVGLGLPHLWEEERRRLDCEEASRGSGQRWEVCNGSTTSRARALERSVLVRTSSKDTNGRQSAFSPEDSEPEIDLPQALSKLRTHQFSYGTLSECVVDKPKKKNKGKRHVRTKGGKGDGKSCHHIIDSEENPMAATAAGPLLKPEAAEPNLSFDCNKDIVVTTTQNQTSARSRLSEGTLAKLRQFEVSQPKSGEREQGSEDSQDGRKMAKGSSPRGLLDIGQEMRAETGASDGKMGQNLGMSMFTDVHEELVDFEEL